MSTATRKSSKPIVSTPVYPHALELHRLLADDDPAFNSALLEAARAKAKSATNTRRKLPTVTA